MQKEFRHCAKQMQKRLWVFALASFLWFLLRTGARPDRIRYPCQQAAIANSFACLAIAVPSITASPLKEKLKKKNIALFAATAAIILAAVLAANYAVDRAQYYASIQEFEQHKLQAAQNAGEISLAAPGNRVVMVHYSEATSWNYSTGWHGDYISQAAVDAMVREGVMKLTGESTPEAAWGSLVPYNSGEEVVIKVNFNNSWSCGETHNIMDAYSESANSVIDGLLSIGVPADKIWITDPSRTLTNRFRAKIKNKSVHYYSAQTSGNCGDPNYHSTYYDCSAGAISPMTNPKGDNVCPAKVFVDAEHVINIPIMKGHSSCWHTLGLKNHYGSVMYASGKSRGEMHAWLEPYGSQYKNTDCPTGGCVLPDISKNPNIDAKTRLILGDSVYGHPENNWSAAPVRWQTWNNDSPNMLFFGTKIVAVDSIMLDWMNEEAIREGYSAKTCHGDLVYGEQIGLGPHDHWQSFSNRTYTKIDYREYDLDAQTCTGTCYPNSCSYYTSCSTASGTCTSGYCCVGSCTQPPVCTDADLDGYGTAGSTGCTYSGTDCNDGNPNIHPGATELCNNADDDCDGQTDEGFDADGDGYKTCSSPPDCNDNNPSIRPGATEKCGDGIDQDCSGADLACSVCTQGAIPSSGCTCGSTNYYSGYCCSGVYSSSPCSGADYFTFEAESGTLAGAMSAVNDSTASGGKYIRTTTSDSGTADYAFNASGGEYVVWVLVLAPPTPGAHNSFYVLMDGSGEDIWDIFYEYGDNSALFPTTWAWDQVTARGAGTFNSNQFDPRKFNLGAGQHTLRFRGRETDSRIDKLVITNDLSYNPGQQCTDADGDSYGSGCSAGSDCNDANASVHANISCAFNGTACGSYQLCVLNCPVPPAENCTDGTDNDCDNLIDCADPNCSAFPDCISCTLPEIKCGASCIVPACTSNANCNDNNALTTDTCNQPGTCNAACIFTPCNVTCSTNTQCNDSNPLTNDICLNAATCNSSCSNTAYPACGELIATNCNCGGSIYSNGLCCNNSYRVQATCSTDAMCDDQNTLTNDTCLNAGTCSASCSNTPIQQPICTAGQTTFCVTSDNCAGTRTCTNNAWGSCVKDNPNCPIIPICTEGQTLECGMPDGCSGTRTCVNNEWTACNRLDPNCPAPSQVVCSEGSTRACTVPDGCTGIQSCSNNAWGNCVKTSCPEGQVVDRDEDGIVAELDCSDADHDIGICAGCAVCYYNECVAGSCPNTVCIEESKCVEEDYYEYPASVSNSCSVETGIGNCSARHCVPKILPGDERCKVSGHIKKPIEIGPIEQVTLQVIVAAVVTAVALSIAVLIYVRMH